MIENNITDNEEVHELADEEVTNEGADLQNESQEENVDFSRASQLDFSDVEEDVECPYEMAILKKVIEAILFTSDKPTPISTLISAFGEETPVTKKHIKEALEEYKVDLEANDRGFRLHSVDKGYQLRTDEDLKEFIQNTIKARSFRLTGPSLETLAMIAYKQPCTKSQIDEIRGVDSSHLIRALMDRDLVAFAGKSELPGKPMLYKTTNKFLEVFGLRNIKELPSLSEIEALLPNGIGDEEEDEKESLSEVASQMSEEFDGSYSASEEELLKINDQLSNITTETEFFEEEKRREKERKDQEKAENIREALMVGEEVSTRDQNWLARYDEKIAGDSEEEIEEESLQDSDDNNSEDNDDESMELLDSDESEDSSQNEEELELEPLKDDTL